MQRYLRLAALATGAVLYVWFTAVRNAPALKRRRNRRWAARW